MRSIPDQRLTGRTAILEERRGSARTFLDLDWFLESQGCSTLGRGLELSLSGAHLPVLRTGAFAAQVVLHISLPGRQRLLKARGRAVPRPGPTGWLVRFDELSEEDRRLLADTLSEQHKANG